MKAGFESGKCT